MAIAGQLGAGDLAQGLRAYSQALAAHRDWLDRLNVYPVPDGDTGTNMALTVECVVATLDALAGRPGGEPGTVSERPTMAETCAAIRRGALMGARGNSGLILCQFLGCLAERWAGSDVIGPSALADALTAASQAAWQAVSEPVEGTILSVAQAMAGGAGGGGSQEGTLLDVLQGARAAGAQALARTPEQLDVLARAGVVDAGGAGLLLLVDALLSVVDGRPLPTSPVAGPGERQVEGQVGGARYEVMFLLEAPADALPGLRATWSALGESVVVTGAGSQWRCHIHTDDIGAALEAGLVAGRPSQVKVSDLDRQVAEERGVREATGPASPS